MVKVWFLKVGFVWRTAFFKLVMLLFVFWLTISTVFLLMALLRGNPVAVFLDPRLNADLRSKLETRFGYDQGLASQYGHYLSGVVQGDFGISFLFKEPVGRVIGKRAPRTLLLGLSAYLLALVLAGLLLFGLSPAVSPLVRRFISGVADVLVATPAFIFATLLAALFAVRLGWFPLYGSRELGLGNGYLAWDRVRHLILPATSLALPLAGTLTAYLRSGLMALEDEPFVLAARGRGVGKMRVFFRHQVSLLLPGLFQLSGLYLPALAGGALVIEAIFGWGGLGQCLFEAVMARDLPLLLGGTLWAAFFTVIGTELADFLRARQVNQEMAS